MPASFDLATNRLSAEDLRIEALRFALHADATDAVQTVRTAQTYYDFLTGDSK